MPRLSNLDLARATDNFPYSQNQKDAGLWFFSHEGTVLGHIIPPIFDAIPWDMAMWSVDRETRHVHLTGRTYEVRTRDLDKFLRSLSEKGIFRVLDRWRDEVYPIYSKGGELFVSMERSATPLFGVLTYGVHMTGYVVAPEGIKIWVPTRAADKQTYPGMLDNTAAGGMGTGEKPIECMAREAHEEAFLPLDYVRENAKPCGTVTYHHCRGKKAGGETGVFQPELQYVYDLKMAADVIPTPNDGEVGNFTLMSLDEVKEALAEGRFKPNCAAVMLDFFVRHGILTPENEPAYVEIVKRLHRTMDFPTPAG